MSNIINKIRLSGTDYTLSATTSGGVTSGEVETMISAATSGYTARFAEDEEVTAAALNDLNERISGISGNNVVELTQAQYDALVSGGTVDPTAFYIITDATPVDISNYWTSAQTQSAITSAVSTKQDTLVEGRAIDITNNTVSLDLPISAGTGTNSIREGQNTTAIGSYSHAEGSSSVAGGYNSHAEGEGTSATSLNSHAEGSYTIASGMSSHAEGSQTMANGQYSHAEGYYTIASGKYSHTEGYATSANNQSEYASGQFNVSNKASTTFGNSGNTLFSVGNGTTNAGRHNAFEIRQNGDIYLSLNGQDVKLQDQLGGGGGTVDQTIISGSTNAVAGGAVYDKFDEVEQVTAAALNTLNDNFGGLKLMKLTQNEYNALSPNYDSNTLYVIVN